MFGVCGVALVLLRFGLGPLTLVLCVVRAAALGFNQATWVYASELFPTTHRVLGIGFTASFARIGSTASLFLAYVLYAASPSITLSLCVLSCAAAIAIALSIPVETAQQPLFDTSR